MVVEQNGLKILKNPTKLSLNRHVQAVHEKKSVNIALEVFV
jgi:hypothetical protein